MTIITTTLTRTQISDKEDKKTGKYSLKRDLVNLVEIFFFEVIKKFSITMLTINIFYFPHKS